MASSSKPTGVHYALIVFVLISIILGVSLLLAYKGSGSIGELKMQNANLQKKASEAEQASHKLLDQITAIKQQLGSGFGDIGDDGANSPPTTVLGDMALHIREHGGDVAQKSYNETIVKLREAHRNVTKARENLQEQLVKEQDTFNKEKDHLNAQLAAEKEARNRADKGKNDVDRTHAEELARKEADLSDLRKHLSTAQQELAALEDSTLKRTKSLEQRITDLLAFNKNLSDQLEQVTRMSFEVPDGKIVLVDNALKRVWIDLGEADGLRPRTTFSVYRRTNSGVGRGSAPHAIGPEDIKGKIEITRILDEHQAEARIIEDDPYNPMGKGDPIYSPIWSPGRGESFSVVGIIDLDGDGKSDRDLFREIVHSAGAVLDNEVDDKGELFLNGDPAEGDKPRITEKTKFLVKGRLPDFTEGADKADKDIIQKINDFSKELDQQARERGVRIVSLSDFLSFMGYKTQRRLYVPGDTTFNLKAGQRPPPVLPGTGSRDTSGNLSGVSPTQQNKAGAKQFRKTPGR
ncbi:MAG: hypothetical protein ACT4QC_07315 [Planctomycetaceae bacterium]